MWTLSLLSEATACYIILNTLGGCLVLGLYLAALTYPCCLGINWSQSSSGQCCLRRLKLTNIFWRIFLNTPVAYVRTYLSWWNIPVKALLWLTAILMNFPTVWVRINSFNPWIFILYPGISLLSQKISNSIHWYSSYCQYRSRTWKKAQVSVPLKIARVISKHEEYEEQLKVISITGSDYWDRRENQH